MKIINIFNKIADSNLAYYLLVIILIIVVIAMIYLIFTQNKEIKEAQKRKIEIENDELYNDPVDDMANEVKVESNDLEENIDRTSKIPIHDSVLQMVEEDLPRAKEVNHYGDIRPIEDVKEEVPMEEELTYIDKSDNADDREPVLTIDLSKEQDQFEEPQQDETIQRVEEVEQVDISPEKKTELLDATMIDIPKIPLLEQTMTSIPPIMDYLDNTQDLIDLTKELELAPKEKTIELTPFEEEQEQNAIISYDELFNNDNNIPYKEEEVKNDVTIKKVDLKEIKEEPKDNYEHEENFLARLKSIQGR